MEAVATGILIQGVLVVSGILAARLLGAEGRGYLALLVLFSVTVAQLGALGLPQSVTHFVAKDKAIAARMMSLVGRTLQLQCVVLVSVHAVVLFAYLHDKPREVVLSGLVTLCVVPVFIAQQYGLAILQSLGRFTTFNVIRVANPALYSAGMAGLLIAGHLSLPMVAGLWSAVQVFVGVMAIVQARKAAASHEAEDEGRPLPDVRRMLVYGVKGMLGYSSPLESFKFDQLVAGLYLSPASLGFYVVAQAFNNLPKFVAQSLGMVAFPFMSTVAPGRKAKSYVLLFSAMVIVLNGLLILPLYYFMPWLVETFFGVEFTSSVPVVRILLMGAFLWSVRRILVECYRGLGYPEASTVAELTMYPVLLLALPLLVPALGLRGLALAIVIGQAAALMTALIFSRRLEREGE
ncbi:MAG: oligosaccharide flippase family protein [Pseudomonadota bacterium]|nr:oligosaccharide flippase family protein [Pseudomonadota bacterium]